MGLRVTLGVCALAIGLEGNARAVAPNYIVIIADDLGSDKMEQFVWDTTDTATAPFPDAPYLETLGTRGLRFFNAWANPVCSPTRASLNTGNYAWQTDIGVQLEPGATGLADVPTLAGVLAASPYNYQTALFGKWHLGEIGYPSGSGHETDWTANGSPGDVGTVFPPPLFTDAAANARYQKFEGFLGGLPDSDGDLDWTRIYPDTSSHWQVATTTSMTGANYPDRVVVNAAKTWIGQVYDDGVPWLAVVALAAPHSLSDRAVYKETDLTSDKGTGSTDYCAKLASGAGRSYTTCVNNPGIVCTQPLIYQALVECMDERIGEFLDALPLAARTNTIIVFMGDNGTLGINSEGDVMQPPYSDPDHPVGKDTVYQSGVRVPFIMTSFRKYKNVSNADFIYKTGPVTSLVQTWDLYATMIDAAAGTATDDGTDSVSLYPCFSTTAGTVSPTCAGANRYHYAEMFEYVDPDAATLVLDWGEATVGVMVGTTEYSMIASYYVDDDCMNTSLYKLTSGGSNVDEHQESPVPINMGNKSLCENQVRAKFETVMPSTGPGWMPRDDSTGGIDWCDCSCTSTACSLP